MAVLVHRRHPQHVIAVAGDAGGHGFVITVPMALLQALRRDDVQGLTQRFAFRIAKNALRRRVPQNDLAAGIRYHDGIAYRGDQLLKVYGVRRCGLH